MRSVLAIVSLVFLLLTEPSSAQTHTPTCASVDEVVRTTRQVVDAAQSRAAEARQVERRAQEALERARRGEPGTRVERTFDRSYQGEWANNARNGLGQAQVTMGANVGEYFIGTFQNNNPHGLGVEGGWINGMRWTYRGDFGDALRHGLGVLEHADGTGWAGEYRAGNVLGRAEIRLPGGGRYLGEVVNAQPNGLGALFENGNVIRGRWANSELSSECTG